MPPDGLSLMHIKETLDSLSTNAEQGKYPANILRDFKLSVDQLRLTLWAVIAAEEQGHKKVQGGVFDLGGRLAEFRIKRLLQMLSALQEDFQKGNIPPSNPDLISLSSALLDTLEHISKLSGKEG